LDTINFGLNLKTSLKLCLGPSKVTLVHGGALWLG